MKLSDFINKINENKNPERVGEYLNSIGVQFDKEKKSNGTKFEIKGKTPEQVKNIVDDILSVSEITKHFDVGYAGGKTISVICGY